MLLSRIQLESFGDMTNSVKELNVMKDDQELLRVRTNLLDSEDELVCIFSAIETSCSEFPDSRMPFKELPYWASNYWIHFKRKILDYFYQAKR